MTTKQLTEQEFPFISEEKDMLTQCQLFLDGKMPRGEFEQYITRKNIDFKQKDEQLDELYRSGGMGRPGIMDGAPEYARAFREEINRILGEAFAWE